MSYHDARSRIHTQVPKKYPSLQENRAMVIVAGRQDAEVYRLKEGSMDKIFSFAVPRPHYSDREGHFEARGKESVFHSGSSRELNTGAIVKEFIREFRKKIRSIHEKFSEVYIFAPNTTKHKLEDALPRAWHDKLSAVIPGNYVGKSPRDIMEKLAKVPHREQEIHVDHMSSVHR